MCDALSWGILRRDLPDIGLKRGQRIGPLTDEEIIAKWGTDASFEDKCGHSALAQYYGISQYDFIHRENFNRIPRPVVKDANAGKFRQCFKASHAFVSVRYRHDGTIAEAVEQTQLRCRKLLEVRDDPELYAKFLEEVRKIPIKPEQQKYLDIAIDRVEHYDSDFYHDGKFGEYSDDDIGEFVTLTLRWCDYDRGMCSDLHDTMQAAFKNIDEFIVKPESFTRKYDRKGSPIE